MIVVTLFPVLNVFFQNGCSAGRLKSSTGFVSVCMFNGKTDGKKKSGLH